MKKLLSIAVILGLFALSPGCSTGSDLGDLFDVIGTNNTDTLGETDALLDDIADDIADDNGFVPFIPVPRTYPSVMPGDFYIIYEYGVYWGPSETLLDSRNDSFAGEKLLLIYDFIVSYDIASYSTPNDYALTYRDIAPSANAVLVDTNYLTKITFCLNGEIISVLHDDSYIESSKDGAVYAFEKTLKGLG